MGELEHLRVWTITCITLAALTLWYALMVAVAHLAAEFSDLVQSLQRWILVTF